MLRMMVSLVLVILCCSAVEAETPVAAYKRLQLTDKFHCEGAYYADFNRDGNLDVVSGPYWYAGPDFQQRHEVREPQEFDPKGYSDNFLTYTGDFNGDGWADILYVPWPGKDASWYENPAGEGRALDSALRPEERRQRIARVGRRQRRRTSRPGLQHRRIPGLRHLGSGPTERAVDVSSRSAPRATIRNTRTAWASATSTATVASTFWKAFAGGNSRPTRSRASLGSAMTTSLPTRPPRCWSTTSTATD